MIVMIFHIDQFSHYFGLASYGFWRTRMQSYAVILFFVLSGFLITLLLMKEREISGTINLRNFYLRRILRTWPVYYLVLALGLVLFTLFTGLVDGGLSRSAGITVIAYSLLIPNIAAWLGYAPDLISILWSVGAEEQFYAFWPFLVRSSRNVLWRITLFLFAWLLVRQVSVGLDFPSRAWSLMQYMPFDCMAIGGIAACWYNSRSRVLAWIYQPAVQVLCWLFFAVSVFYQPLRMPGFGLFNIDLHAVVYAVIILNVSTNMGSIVKLENKVLDFLGRISYGIYGYHFIVLFLLSVCLGGALSGMPSKASHGIMFSLVISCTIFFAWLSRIYFENWFLKRGVRV
jgi:peptidoglycan/LPS O-acetylase OafA/YrhL